MCRVGIRLLGPSRNRLNCGVTRFRNNWLGGGDRKGPSVREKETVILKLLRNDTSLLSSLVAGAKS